MSKILNIISIVAMFVCFAAQPASATEQKAKTIEECQKIYDACYAQCRKDYPTQDLEGDAQRTTCGTTCAAQRTACKAAVEYATKARPALEDMIEKLKSFLDEILKSLPEGNQAPSPDQKPKSGPEEGPVKI
ncbi:MAG: hypothetical protein ACO3MW_06225 [Rhodospirillales bacterium]|jgi:hypothetical protein